MSIRVDTTEFNAALKAYKAASRRAWPEIVNKQTANVAWEAAKVAEKAEKAVIRDLVNDQPKWSKMIAKLLAKTGYTLKVKRRVKSRGKRKKTVVESKLILGHYTRAQAKRVSAAIIRRRLHAVSWLKSAFYKAAKSFRPVSGGQSRDDLSTTEGVGTPARWGIRTMASLTMSWMTKSERPHANLKGAQAKAGAAMRHAVAWVAKDMRQHVEQKLAGLAAKHNAVRAR